MLPAFLSPSRTVLLVGDEALCIYSVTRSSVKLIKTLAWKAPNFVETVSRTLTDDCRKKPVLILYDMVEQHYRKEKVPRVGVLDKGKVVKRRLAMAFPTNPIRAAMPLKEKSDSGSRQGGGEGESQLGGSLFLFASIPQSESFMRTMGAVRHSLVNVAGFCLLPIEGSDMTQALSAGLRKKDAKPSRWVVLIGQHRGGGLRQIVVKDGGLALTRLTPVVDTDADPEAWADEVLQEFKATMAYISRFGYHANDGLDVIAIANPGAGEILEREIDVSCNFSSVTVSEAARILGLSIGKQDDQRYADALHASWVGRKRLFLLPMHSRDIENVARPRQAAMLATLVLGAGLAFLSYQSAMAFQDVMRTSEKARELQERKGRADKIYNEEIERKKALGYDVRLVKSSLLAYKQFRAQEMAPVPVLQKIGQALGPELRVNSMEIKFLENKPSAQPGFFGQLTGSPDAPSGPEMQIILYFVFPGTLKPEDGVRTMEMVQKQIAKLLPDYSVSISKQVADLSYTGNFVGEVGPATATRPGQPPKEYTAEILIKGAPS